jgi:hypothetical protein
MKMSINEMYFIEKSISDDEYYNYCEIIKEKSKGFNTPKFFR